MDYMTERKGVSSWFWQQRHSFLLPTAIDFLARRLHGFASSPVNFARAAAQMSEVTKSTVGSAKTAAAYEWAGGRIPTQFGPN
jgi:hypothetical protein